MPDFAAAVSEMTLLCKQVLKAATVVWRIPSAKRALCHRHAGSLENTQADVCAIGGWKGLSWQGRGRVEQSITDRQIRAVMTSGN